MEGPVLVGGAQTQDRFRSLVSPIAHTGLFAAGTHQGLALCFHLAAAHRQSQLTIAGIIHVLLVVFQIGQQFLQRLAFGGRACLRLVLTDQGQGDRDATLP